MFPTPSQGKPVIPIAPMKLQERLGDFTISFDENEIEEVSVESVDKVIVSTANGLRKTDISQVKPSLVSEDYDGLIKKLPNDANLIFDGSGTWRPIFPGGETLSVNVTNDDTKIPTAGAVYRAIESAIDDIEVGAVAIESSRIEVTSATPISAGYIFSLATNDPGVYDIIGDLSIDLGEDSWAFKLDHKIQIYLNGAFLDKEDEVTWESPLTFSLSIDLDAGDRIITRRIQ